MKARGQSDLARAVGQYPAGFRDEGDEVRCEVFLNVRKMATVELHALIVAGADRKETGFAVRK
jgi:hypothetical protein